MIFQVISKNKKIRKGLQSSDPRVLANFRVIFTKKKQKTGHFDQPAGTPGHGLKIGTVPAKLGRMASLPIFKCNLDQLEQDFILFPISCFSKLLG